MMSPQSLKSLECYKEEEMHCPYCGNKDTQVKDSRASQEGESIRRRRYCPECGSRFTTIEQIHMRELMVVKKDGRVRPLSRDKIISSMQIAARKRPISQEVIEETATRIILNLEKTGENEIKSSQIGEEIMRALQHLDKVAYIRFASVYKDFEELKDFEDFVARNADKP